MSKPSREYFTESEAKAKVGKRIKTVVAYGVPKGTTGKVIRASEDGDSWMVEVEWDGNVKNCVVRLVRSKPPRGGG